MDVRGLRYVRRVIDLHDDPRPLAVYRRDEGRTGLPRSILFSQLETQSLAAALVAVRAAARAAGDGEDEEGNERRRWYKPPMHPAASRGDVAGLDCNGLDARLAELGFTAAPFRRAGDRAPRTRIRTLTPTSYVVCMEALLRGGR